MPYRLLQELNWKSTPEDHQCSMQQGAAPAAVDHGQWLQEPHLDRLHWPRKRQVIVVELESARSDLNPIATPSNHLPLAESRWSGDEADGQPHGQSPGVGACYDSFRAFPANGRSRNPFGSFITEPGRLTSAVSTVILMGVTRAEFSLMLFNVRRTLNSWMPHSSDLWLSPECLSALGEGQLEWEGKSWPLARP